MTTFGQFCANCKIRHDFADMLQVRYIHTSGEEFDTWVSGKEVLQRLRSEAAEQRLKGLSRLDRKQIEEARNRLPDKGKEMLRASITNWIGDQVDNAIGGNLIGDNLAEALQDQDISGDNNAIEHHQWQALLQHKSFRHKVLELAWIQLEGSFPETNPPAGQDDWV